MSTMTRTRTLIASLLVTILSLPALIVFPLAFSNSRFVDISGFSLRWFYNATTPFWRDATLLSITLAASTATLASCAAITAAYYGSLSAKTERLYLLDLTASAILLIPPISLAVGYFRIFGESSLWVLLLGHATLGFAFPYLALRAGARHLDGSIIQAAALLGGSPIIILLHIWLPTLWRPLAAGWMLAFLSSWDETVLSVFAVDHRTVTLPRAIWETMLRERDLTAAAINAVVAPVFSIISMSLLGLRRTQT